MRRGSRRKIHIQRRPCTRTIEILTGYETDVVVRVTDYKRDPVIGRDSFRFQCCMKMVLAGWARPGRTAEAP